MMQTKDKNQQTGNKRQVCPYYEELDAVLAKRASSQPVAILETCGTTLAGCSMLF